jgi:predicted hotdog family 3-hydroxylacyl-ACP dehydratase
VAEVLAVEVDGGSVRLDTHAGLDLLQMTEACAQTVAVLLGAELRQHGGPAASGMLVGVKDMGCTRTVQPGEDVRCTARLAHALDPFRLYAVTITAADGSVLLDGEIKTMSTGGAA